VGSTELAESQDAYGWVHDYDGRLWLATVRYHPEGVPIQQVNPMTVGRWLAPINYLQLNIFVIAVHQYSD